jgi:hypothetical protein
MAPVIALLLIDCLFLAHVFYCARQLPARVASHFQFGGEADGWLSRRAYLTIMAFMGPGLSLVWIALVWALRDHPARLVFQHVAWAGGLLMGFLFGIHMLVVKANQLAAPRLPMNLFWSYFAVLQLGLIVWLLTWPK